VFSHLIFSLWFAGLIVLAAGLVTARKSFIAARGLEKFLELGPVFFAAPLAVFGAEHFTNAQGIAQIVPPWMPARLFWVYFVGSALIAAAFSIALRIRTRLSATLLGIMFSAFVLMIHLPNVAANPGNRFLWAVALRDLTFATGAFALAGMRTGPLVAVSLLFFAVEHFLHPEFMPGVPLAKLTPDWVPPRDFWGYLTGIALLISGTAMLVDRRGNRARLAVTLLGVLITALVVFLYLPIFLMAAPAGMLEGVNYVFDTLLFAGAVLAVARTLGGAACQDGAIRSG
jgi:uncharacterized membrane protein